MAAATLYVCIQLRDGFWFPIAYLDLGDGNGQREIWKGYACSDKRDAQQEALAWWERNKATPPSQLMGS
jgi:hypothetical protein